MKPVEPRPTLKSIAAATAELAIIGWMRGLGQQPQNSEGFSRAVQFLFMQGDDAYKLARFAEDQWQWSANADLVMVLHHALTTAKANIDEKTKEWVLRSGVRFPLNPRDPVQFRNADGELCHGVVQNVLPKTAEAVVAMITELEDRTLSTPLVRITAEEVVERMV